MPKPTPRVTRAAAYHANDLRAALAEAESADIGRFMPLIMLLFVGSGCAALIYEIVWFQLLQLVIGSAGVSLGVLLGTYMGGMCLGSLLLPRLVAATRHPLRVYALLELGTGVCGIIVYMLVPLVGHVYVHMAGSGLAGLLMRGAVCAVCLLLPTMLMGATLPAIARWVKGTPTGASWLGFLYGANIAGAVVGCLAAGFYLLRVYDMLVATEVAVAINALIGGLALLLASTGAQRHSAAFAATAPDYDDEERPVMSRLIASKRLWIYVAIGLSGLTALGAEVIWTRLLSLMLGASVYTFSIILGVVLIGLGGGTAIGARRAREATPERAFAMTQMLLVVGLAWAALAIASWLPYWPINPSLARSPWTTFELDFVRALLVVLPASLCWGASFPLAISAAVTPGEDPGRTVGLVYATNTLGGIIGALAFSLVVIPTLGTQRGQQLLVALAIVSSLVLTVPALLDRAATPGRRRSMGYALATIIVGVPLVLTVHAVPPGLVAYGRFLATYTTEPRYLYVGEGMNSSIAVSQEPDGVRNFHVAGKVEASSEPQDMRLQRMLGHLSSLLHHEPRSVLVVGFGAGVTAGSFVTDPAVKRIVICEIEPLIPAVVSRYFTEQNHNVLADPRVQVVYDDARHYILTTNEKFDVITSDPIHPWVKGAATLYTKEYFDLVKQHLNPGGVVTQWVPLYESHTDVVKSELATFFDAFPSGTVWGNDIQGRGYDVVLAGQTEPMHVDVDAMQARLDRPQNALAAQSLAEVGFTSAVSLMSTYAGQARDLRPWLADAQINHDRDLRLQYLAGMGLNSYQEDDIYQQMLSYRRYPDNLFTASVPTRATLEQSLGSRGGGL